MPQIIKTIDQIARELQRDVLMIEFQDAESSFRLGYRKNPSRMFILDTLERCGVPYYACGPYADDTGIEGYRGQIYIDVPIVGEDRRYREVQVLMTNPGGLSRFKDAWLRYLPLEKAMENAHHDAPGYWENTV